MAKKKIKLNQKESDTILPIIREFNKITKAVITLMGKRVQAKEKKISVMVSRIKRPDQGPSQIRVKSVEFTKGFLNRQKKKKGKQQNQSEWDDNFSQKRGHII